MTVLRAASRNTFNSLLVHTSAICFVYLFIAVLLVGNFERASSAPVGDSSSASEGQKLDPSFNEIAADIAAELHRLRDERMKLGTENSSGEDHKKPGDHSIISNAHEQRDAVDQISFPHQQSASAAGDTKNVAESQMSPSKSFRPLSPSTAGVRTEDVDQVHQPDATSQQKVDTNAGDVHNQKQAFGVAQIRSDGLEQSQKETSSFDKADENKVGNERPIKVKTSEARSKAESPNNTHGKSQKSRVHQTEHQDPKVDEESYKLQMTPQLNQEQGQSGLPEKKLDEADTGYGVGNEEQDQARKVLEHFRQSLGDFILVSVAAHKNEDPKSPGDPDKDFLSPSSLAEYIMATGDEESVAMAVEDLLKDGLLSREEAIKYLREVKGRLESMRAEAAVQEMLAQEQQQEQNSGTAGANNWDPDELLTSEEKQQLEALGNQIMRGEHETQEQEQLQLQNLQHFQPSASADSRLTLTAPSQLMPYSAMNSAMNSAAAPFPIPVMSVPGPSAAAAGTMNGPSYTPAGVLGMDSSSGTALGLSSSATSSLLDSRVLAALFGSSPAASMSAAAEMPSVSKYAPDEAATEGQTPVESQHRDLADRLKFVDRIYTEYGLEDVLYKLAKLMFNESLKNTGRGASAESILAKLNVFLNEEEKAGHMTPDLQKRIQDVLVASLFDSVQEDVFGNGNKA